MKTLLLSMISIAATFAAMTACTIESDPINEINPQDGKTPIEFRSSIIGVQTKAISSDGTKFDANTNIALTMYKGENAPTGEALGNPAKESIEFTVGADQLSLAEKATPKTMFWERNIKHYFYAYYPIVESNTNYTLTPAVDKTSAEKITVKVPLDGNTTDLLMGKITTGLTYSGATVENANISFSHKLSKINFVFKKDPSFQGQGALTDIKVKIANSEVSFDLVSQLATLGGSPMDITKTGVTQNIETNDAGEIYSDWSPIVTPGTTISELSLTIDGKQIKASNLNTELAEGSITKITLTLKGSEISDLTTGITEWKDDKTGSGDII